MLTTHFSFLDAECLGLDDISKNDLHFNYCFLQSPLQNTRGNIEKEIASRVDQVVKDIWSSVEYESACREISNILADVRSHSHVHALNALEEIPCNDPGIDGHSMPIVSKQISSGDGKGGDTCLPREQQRLVQSVSEVCTDSLNGNLVLVSYVLQEWLTHVHFTQQQSIVASAYFSYNKQQAVFMKWVVEHKVRRNVRIMRERQEMEKEAKSLAVADQFHSLYYKQHYFQIWSLASYSIKEERDRILEVRLEAEKEVLCLTTARKYRKVILLRQMIRYWKEIIFDIRAIREKERKLQIVKSKIQERIHQERQMQENKKKIESSLPDELLVPINNLRSENAVPAETKEAHEETNENQIVVLKTSAVSRHAELVLDRKLIARLNHLVHLHSNRRICLRFGWIPWSKQIKHQKNALLKAQNHYSRHLENRVYFEWKMHMIPKKWSIVVEEINMFGQASERWINRMKDHYFQKWDLLSWTSAMHKTAMKRRFLLIWKDAVEVKAQLNDVASCFSKKLLTTRVFASWATYYKNEIIARKEASLVLESKLRHKLNNLTLKTRLADWRSILAYKKATEQRNTAWAKVKNWITDYKNHKTSI